MRIGIGYDTHRVAPCRRLVLGGVDIPHDKGLLGHSDADALLHAIMDALLGAAGKSDIGTHFPDTDESLKDISSMTLLARVAAMLRAERFTVVNIDAVIIAQKPKLAPYIQQMRENIASVLGIPVKMVNVKATTEEGLGFVGAEEGISAQAVCILESGGWKTMGIFESVRSIKARDPAIRSGVEIILYPTFWSMGFHRVAHALYNCKLFFVSRLISQLSRLLTGIEIHPGAKIGKRFFIDHGMGVVIGETCEIGDDVIVYQGVTLGGTGKDTGKRHPTLGNNVLVGSGAKVLGGFTVGNNVRIGAGSVVLSAVPDDCTVVGIPARIIARKEDGLKSERLEQRFPDPVAMELCQMKSRIEQLEAELRALKGEGEEETAAPGGGDEPAKENHDENLQHVE